MKPTDQLLQAFKYITPDISDKELNELLPLLTEIKLRRSKHLVTVGKNYRYLNFIAKGAARMYYIDRNGNEKNIKLVIENDFIHDYESLLINKPAKFNIQATEDCHFVLIDYNRFEELLCSSKNWEHCGRIINQYVLIGIFKRAQSFLFLTPEQRYMRLLCDEPWLLQRFSQEYIATYIGVKRESLSRIRGRVAKRRNILTEVT